MRIAIVGGKLQGLEAAYLTQKAGWEATVLDQKPNVPARGLADRFYQIDVNNYAELEPILKEVDLIIPALENQKVLDNLEKYVAPCEIPLVLDSKAYYLSASKKRSNELFSRIGVPMPAAWPNCGFPIIAKPSGASGSQDVHNIKNQEELEAVFSISNISEAKWVMQEFLSGPSFSIEVIGFNGRYRVLQITELEMDASYDCKRVIAPAELPENLQKQFEQIALLIAQAINLNGIMDVEVILHHQKLKVLEIDARLPSQTPTAVFQSSGINMVELLGNSFVKGNGLEQITIEEKRGVIYEHLAVSPGKMEVCGEHLMSGAGELQLEYDFYGADEAITNYRPGEESWAATLIVTGDNRIDAWQKRCKVIERIRREFNLTQYSDPVPLV